MENSAIWLIVFVLTLIIEGLTVNLVSIWFTIGSLFAFLTSYLTNNLTLQIIIFVTTSIIALFITRPLAKKIFSKNVIKTNCNKLIGETAIVIEEMSHNKIGKVKIDGQIWSAINIDKEIININSEVEVLSIEGVKLIIRRIK